MSSVRTKRIAKSTVNTPVTVELLASKSVTKEDAERFLTNFIQQEEERTQKNLLNTINVPANTVGSISQLKRIQRDLRGLPPLESSITSSNPTPQPTSENSKKHKKFDADPLPTEEVEQVEPETSVIDVADEDAMDIDVQEEPEETLSKEEKKRLKKEKKEKKDKKKSEKK